MAQAKMKPSDLTADQVISALSRENKRTDALRLLTLFQETTGFPPVVWADRIIGFGHMHYRYKSGHEGDMPLAAFAVSDKRITLYLYMDPATRQELLDRLGKATASKSCIYINKLSDVDVSVIAHMEAENLHLVRTTFPGEEVS